ncbi:hypothetical protein CU633_22075 [Bacillus sp. V3-13]|uniref:hypothetical protein n=1 Tax=Bacillus sp. V3-13 TaxID=2053728 RepID=UPI000C76BDEA|nr:hypothetical protein [Bacillus sp. V3-13]PLR75269.1 hypothetical protein CU633_22075 [Bacillus sp. V3-13]
MEKKQVPGSSIITRNKVGKYNLKIVYPGIFRKLDNPSAGFPKNKRPLAEKMTVGSIVFIYVTSPYKKIIGVCEPTQNMIEVESERWPYNVPLRWIVGPCSPGVSLKEASLDIRPRPGDTNFILNEEEANRVITILQKQGDIDDTNDDRLLD